MKKIGLLVTLIFWVFIGHCQNPTYSSLILTNYMDQFKFEVSGENRYWFMSKTQTDNKAFALFSPDDGYWFTYWKEGSGDMVLSRGSLGIGITNPAAALDIKHDSNFNWIHLNDGNGNILGNLSRFGNGLQIGTWNGGTSHLILDPNGYVGVGTTNPQSELHVSSASVSEASTGQYDSNFIIESTSNVRKKDEGASLGFVVPANTDGSNPWQQGRILVTPDNQLNGNASGRMLLQTRYYDGIGAWRWRNNIVLNSAGNVGIGTTSIPSSYKLAVDGTIGAREVNVESTPWPDYVFSDTYQLNPLSEVSTYIQENHHLPGIPTAEEVAENGIKLGEMNAKLLEKVEELTLYQIQLLEMLEKQQKEIEILKSKVK